MEKLNIAVFFGGDSVEHDVSVITGLQICNALDKLKYNIYPIYIDKSNNWLYIKNYKDVQDIYYSKNKPIQVKFGEKFLYIGNILKSKIKIHCAVLGTHGGLGESGGLFAILKSLDIPITASDITSSVCSMDKILTKYILEKNRLNVLPYMIVQKGSLNEQNLLDFISENSFPLVVKPSNLGSSIAVNMVKNFDQLKKAIELALNFSDKCIVEKGIARAVEYNCSAFVQGQEIMVSDIEKPVKLHDILDYKDKYGNQSSNGTKPAIKQSIKNGMNGSSREFPAKIEDRLKKQIQDTTKLAYELFGCAGIIRCDFIYYRKKLYLNEINSIPGSLAYYLWSHKSCNFSMLLDLLIKQSIKSHITSNY